jgi:hypothetical protein
LACSMKPCFPELVEPIMASISEEPLIIPQRINCNVLPPRPSCPDKSRNVTVPAG